MEKQMTNAMHRDRARKALSGKWGTMALIVFASFLIKLFVSNLIGSFTNLSSESASGRLINFILSNGFYFALTFGTYFAALQVIRERPVKVEMLLMMFRGEYYLPLLLINLIQYVLNLLINFIMLLPVLISYGATMYFGLMFNVVSVERFQQEMSANITLAFVMLLFSLLVILISMFIGGVFQFAVWVKIDQPALGIGDILREALNMMKGHFKQYVFLQLSFIGWYIVGAIVVGIGLLWVIPYHDVAVASLYDSIRREKEVVF
ncbi:DUF975 family protein [Enterococcus sp. CWB-B31]|uniref:DUF975 family protein n=1 Tax=Enterococcus sp. CWB-B31 TaxID=2885159 RepID=UPI001E5FD842|nr:DUF975 family protein [Enterococcus sp. CWB-B31]MCB5956392.1 DUF975 family protein [Enterococcus sp. CWB-B31]